VRRPDWVDGDLYPFADHWTASGGALVHHVDEGDGTPLLLVHGNPTWSFLYRHVIRELGPRFRCVAPDLPGFGLTEAPHGYGFTPAEHAGVLADLIAALDLRDYVLFGQDWGGPLALAAAAREPDRVAGLVLGNTWAWSLRGNLGARAWSLALGGPAGRLASERLNSFARGALRLRRRPLSAAEREHYLRPFPTPASRRPTWTFAREVTSRFLADEVEPALARLRDRPALLVWGDRDPVFRLSDRDRLARELPHATQETLRGAGHFIQDDAPGEIAAAIARWWRG
jgi:haloalkane dehalogenase